MVTYLERIAKLLTGLTIGCPKCNSISHHTVRVEGNILIFKCVYCEQDSTLEEIENQ